MLLRVETELNRGRHSTMAYLTSLSRHHKSAKHCVLLCLFWFTEKSRTGSNIHRWTISMQYWCVTDRRTDLLWRSATVSSRYRRCIADSDRMRHVGGKECEWSRDLDGSSVTQHVWLICTERRQRLSFASQLPQNFEHHDLVFRLPYTQSYVLQASNKIALNSLQCWVTQSERHRQL